MTSVSTQARRRALTRAACPLRLRERPPKQGRTLGEVLASLPFSDVEIEPLLGTSFPGKGLPTAELPD